jgi:hypothetical protein
MSSQTSSAAEEFGSRLSGAGGVFVGENPAHLGVEVAERPPAGIHGKRRPNGASAAHHLGSDLRTIIPRGAKIVPRLLRIMAGAGCGLAITRYG